VKTSQFIELLALAAIWGASFLFMRVGSPELGPFLFTLLRTGIAALFLIACIKITKKRYQLNGYKFKIFCVGIMNTAIPFVLFSYATLTLTAGTTSVLNATVPMFGALVAYIWLKDKLSITASIGLLFGFLGVYLLMAEQVSVNRDALLPALAAIGAAACYGIAASMTKKYLSGLSPLLLATGSQASATIALLPLGLMFIPTEMPSSEALLSVVAIGILCTGIAYIMFFRLIDAVGPAKTISVTYLIPFFGIFWGFVFLEEQITTKMITTSLITLFGVALTTGIFDQFPFKKKSAQ